MPACIWFLSRMSLQVSFKITFCGKSLCTLSALIWFIPSVYFKMPYKMNIPKKTFVTFIALVWFFASMSPYMQVRCLLKYKSVCNMIYISKIVSELNELSHWNNIYLLVHSREFYFSIALK